jgi:hypothetical protein
MSDLDRLRELVRQLPPPQYESLVAVARKRRRRSALGVAAGAAAVVVLAVWIAPSLPGVAHTSQPVQQPSPSTVDGWTPDRIRAEGERMDYLAYRSGGPSPSSIDTTLYCTGQPIESGSPCDPYHYDPEQDQHWSLEVTQGGQSALFEVQGRPWIGDFDEDSILVEDGSLVQDGTTQAVRYRLLQADGTAVQLRMVSDLAPAIPGPDVMLIQDLDGYRNPRGIGPDQQEPPYLVDDGAGTIQPLDVPQEVEWWGPNVDEALWGATGCRVTWQQPDGNFDLHDADCRPRRNEFTDPDWPAFTDWLEPGRMAIVEKGNDGAPMVVHASVNWGTTWQRIELPFGNGSDPSLAERANALAAAFGRLG